MPAAGVCHNIFDRRMKGQKTYVFNSASVPPVTEALLRAEQRHCYGRNRASVENASLSNAALSVHNLHKNLYDKFKLTPLL